MSGFPVLTCVLYGIRQCNRIFSCGEISGIDFAFFAKKNFIFFISVVILNSSLCLHYQIFEFDINIQNQILVWIIGMVAQKMSYRKGEILKQK